MKTSTTDINARGLGDESLLQSYFVCVTESNSTTLVEYGKSLGSSDSGDIYLNMLDANRHLNVRFYAFGNSGAEADVIDAHIVSRDLTQAECKGETHLDLESRLCTQKCHEDCDPLHGRTASLETQGQLVWARESRKAGEGEKRNWRRKVKNEKRSSSFRS